MDAILKLDGVEKVYHPGTSLECRALQPANLEFTKGRFYAIVGKSGSGKSTMLHILGGLDRPTGGKVYLEGKSVFDLKDRQLAILRRRRIGMFPVLQPAGRAHGPGEYFHSPEPGRQRSRSLLFFPGGDRRW